jgi:hypothetical protein
MAGIERFASSLCELANQGETEGARAITLKHGSSFPTAETWRSAFAIVRSDAECAAAIGAEHCLKGLRWPAREPFKITNVRTNEYRY